MGENGYGVFQERFSEEAAQKNVYSILDDAILNHKSYSPNIKVTANMFQYFMDLIVQETLLPTMFENRTRALDAHSQIPVDCPSSLHLKISVSHIILFRITMCYLAWKFL